MSAEVIKLVISAVSVVLAVLGGTRAIVVLSEKKLDVRFDKIDARFDKVDAELHEIHRDIGDVKERIARLKGPKAQLQLR